VRALVVRGAGKVFSAGADVALFAGMSAQQLRPLIGSFIDLGHRIERLPFPTLAAVHGTAMGGGFELALFCDLIWAAEGTMIGLPETRLGIVPLAGGVERIAARAGLWRARKIALGGELYPAEQFANWGVVDRVVAADELHAAARWSSSSGRPIRRRSWRYRYFPEIRSRPGGVRRQVNNLPMPVGIALCYVAGLETDPPNR
jgi:enoyl-CoA hydratase/carnithine racemase